MTRIAKDALEAVEKAARRAWPEEACGLLIGSGDVIREAVVSENASKTPERAFLIDPALHLRTQRRAREKGLKILGVFHSHPSGGPTPSPEDARAARQAPSLLWLISAAGKDGRVQTRLFRPVRQKNGGGPPALEETRLLFAKSVA